MTAQDRFRAMLRDEIAPALRQRGFKGSGTSYVLPDDSHWLQLGFQSSRTPWQRLGSLAFGEDHWWAITDRPSTVAAAVLEAIDRFGVPWLRAKGEAR